MVFLIVMDWCWLCVGYGFSFVRMGFVRSFRMGKFKFFGDCGFG